MASKTPEKKVQDLILSYLKEMKKSGEPLFYERRQAGGASYKKGIPDIYAVYNGIHIEIEVKKPGGKQSTMQEKFQKMCENINIIYICVDNLVDFKEIFNIIKLNS